MYTLVATRLHALHQKLANIDVKHTDPLASNLSWLMNELWLVCRCAFILSWDKTVVSSDKLVTSGLMLSLCLVADLPMMEAYPNLQKLLCSFFAIASMSGPCQMALVVLEASVGIRVGKMVPKTQISDQAIMAIVKSTQIRDQSDCLAYRNCTTCGWCQTFGDNTFKKCGGCRMVYYCSTECQRADWQQHKVACV